MIDSNFSFSWSLEGLMFFFVPQTLGVHIRSSQKNIVRMNNYQFPHAITNFSPSKITAVMCNSVTSRWLVIPLDLLLWFPFPGCNTKLRLVSWSQRFHARPFGCEPRGFRCSRGCQCAPFAALASVCQGGRCAARRCQTNIHIHWSELLILNIDAMWSVAILLTTLE